MILTFSKYHDHFLLWPGATHKKNLWKSNCYLWSNVKLKTKVIENTLKTGLTVDNLGFFCIQNVVRIFPKVELDNIKI